MRWRRGGQRDALTPADEPVVLPVAATLSRAAAADIAAQVDRLGPSVQVVIDLTGINGFDTDGATDLLGLQERIGAARLTIVGFRQAAARLVGSDVVDRTEVRPAAAPSAGPAAAPSTPASPAAEHGWVVRRLRNLAVVQPADGDIPSTDDLEPVVTEALAMEVAIVVVDLRDTTGLSALGLHALTFASSTAAVSGQELLVVNVDDAAAEALRRSGLSATTYVAP